MNANDKAGWMESILGCLRAVDGVLPDCRPAAERELANAGASE
ncbi:hypothetical protein [Pseudoxanthomonas wuyuanensis]